MLLSASQKYSFPLKARYTVADWETELKMHEDEMTRANLAAENSERWLVR